MTYKKLSDITGFSVSTVSKAFSGSKEISETTKNKIFNAAHELGCYDKYCKEKYIRKTVAVICPEFSSRYYASFVETTQTILKKNGYITVLSASSFDSQAEDELIDYYANYAKVDAIIIISPTTTSIKKYSIPILIISGCIKDKDSIYISMNGAIGDAITFLKENSHEKIAFIGEKLTYAKEKAFIEEMAKQGLKINYEYIICSNKRFEEAGMKATKELLTLPNPPTAIIAAYDYIALGAASFIKSCDLKIPDDISIIGMDDIPDSKNHTPPLASIKTHMHEAVSIAVDIITKKLNQPSFKIIQNIEIPAQLIKRSSVGKCK